MNKSTDPLGEFANWDPVETRLVRHNLGLLADQEGPSPLGRLLRDVLTGRRDVQALRDSEEFVALTTSIASKALDDYNALDPEMREQLIAEGKEALAQARDKEPPT